MYDRAEKTIREALALAQSLAIAPELEARMRTMAPLLPWEDLLPLIGEIQYPDTAAAAMERAEQILAPAEQDGAGSLLILLAAAAGSLPRLRQKGIPEQVLRDTLLCLPRMAGEYRSEFGRWGFDRGFWAWRQVSGCLFRLGTLEFEYRGGQGEVPAPGADALGSDVPVVYVHIPTDARLEDAALKQSYRMAQDFFSRFPVDTARCTGRPKAFLCESWLLSPALQSLLAPSSGIRRFAADYRILFVNWEDDNFYHWLFRGEQDLAALPLRTSLQRSVAELLRSGKKIGSACGIRERGNA